MILLGELRTKENWPTGVLVRGYPLRVPAIEFAWPPVQVWAALLEGDPQPPTLVWPDDEQVSPRIDTRNRMGRSLKA